jgi:hypothetical protein
VKEGGYAALVEAQRDALAIVGANWPAVVALVEAFELTSAKALCYKVPLERIHALLGPVAEGGNDA